MNELDKRKLNLLVHLARVDGKYERAERKLLQQFVAEKGLADELLDGLGDPDLAEGDLQESDARIELLYWAIRLMKADHVIHEKELNFVRSIESKLNFKEGIFAYYANKTLNDFQSFQREVKQVWLSGV